MLGLVACASATPQPTIASTTFAPELGIDTTSMAELPGGIWYRDLQVGTGALAAHGRTVSVHYAGMFPDGRVFEMKRAPEPPIPVRLGSGQVIEGWERGIPGMREGGSRLLVIPPRMAYGRSGTEVIPPNSTLVFIIEVAEVR